jgi:hypothetical protein
MSRSQWMEELSQLSDLERLEIIEAATRMIRSNFTDNKRDSAADSDRRIRSAAVGVKDLYETGTEWNALDSEDFVDEYLPR